MARGRRSKEPDAPHVAAATRYAADVVAGAIPACLAVRQACARFQNDLARQPDPAWPFRFDNGKAERICRFLECLPHSKGKWASKRELLRLEPWQSFLLVNVFGWLRKADGLRRFREAFIVVPRKNGKSALSAPIGLYMLAADGEYGAEVYSGATTEKQAWEVFRPAMKMAKATPSFLSRFGVKVNASNIHIEADGSRFEPVIGKPGDGSSPSCAIIDEYHEHQSPEQHDTMQTGMGAREQPLMWVITTAGDNIAGPCYDKLLTVKKILAGTIVDEEIFGIEFTIDEDDDWTSEAAILKANPNAGISISLEFLLGRQRAAIRNPRDQAVFKTKHLNLWVNAKSALFNMQSWTACRVPDLTLEQMRGRRCIVGLDLASKNDIAAMQLLFPLDDGKYATFGFYYLPREILEQEGKEHYAGWASADPVRLILTEGNMIDFTRIEEDLETVRQNHDVLEVVFDPSQATMFVSRLMDKNVSVQQFDQNARNYSEPTKQVQALVDAGKLQHDCEPNDPMSWMMSNVVGRIDAKDQVYPRKEKPENKIDGPIALIMAMARAMALGDNTGRSIYETRGLLVLR
jgi:phage terminase large subunit-like protein